MQNLYNSLDKGSNAADIEEQYKKYVERYSACDEFSEKDLEIIESEEQRGQLQFSEKNCGKWSRDKEKLKEKQEEDALKLFCGGPKRSKKNKEANDKINKEVQAEKQQKHQQKNKTNQLATLSISSKSKQNQNVCWIRDDDFDDHMNWSDDEKSKPDLPHQSYFSNQSPSEVKWECSNMDYGIKKTSKSNQKQRGKMKKDSNFFQDCSFSQSRQLKAKKSNNSKQPSLQLFSHIQENSSGDDNLWFEQVKRQELAPQDIQKMKQKETKERRDYQAYKKRLYRKKKMSQTRKVFQKQQLESLRKQFEILHNQQDSDEENLQKRPRRDALGLHKLTLNKLAKIYGSSPATINSLYKEWRFDPTLSKPLSKFERIFTLQWGNKPARQVIARERTQRRIQTLTRLIDENPFLTLQEMLDALEQSEQYQQRIFHSTIFRLIKMGEFNRKRFRVQNQEKNSTESITQRKTFALHFKNYLNQDYQIFFYDQMLVNQYYDQDYGWSRGDKEVNYRPESMIEQSIVILGLYSMEGDLLWDARYGNYAPPEFDEVLKSFIISFEKKKAHCNRVIVINQISYRNFDSIKEKFEKSGWEVLKLPQSGLELNPLSSYFSDMREHIKRKKFKTFEALFQQIVNYFKDNEQRYFGLHYIRQLEMYLRRADQSQYF